MIHRLLKTKAAWLAVCLLAAVWAPLSPQGLRRTAAAPEVTGAVIPLGGPRIMRAVPAMADFNGDRIKEIVVGTYDGRLVVISWTGTRWAPVWSRQVALDINAASPPQPQPNTRFESAVAIADLDRDGRKEIVVAAGGLPESHLNGGVLVYGYNSVWNFSLRSNWPQPKLDEAGNPPGAGQPDGYWDGIYSSPALGDLDGDGDLEIVWESEDRRIHAYHHTGSVVSGWPFYRYNYDPLTRGGISSPALGDIYGDGRLEVIVGGTSPRCAPGNPPEGCASADYSVAAVWAINGNSTLVPGWPKYVPSWVDSSPAIGNIDSDGQLEVVVGTGRQYIAGTGGYQVFAWNGDGSPVTGWPKATDYVMTSSPALADLDGGGLDVVIGCGSDSSLDCTTLYAWHGNGANVSGFPATPRDSNPWPGGRLPMPAPFPPSVADIDNDGQMEILLTSMQSWGISVIEHTGQTSTDVTRNQQMPSYGFYSPPQVADVDGDGLLETVAAGEANGQAAIYIWNEAGSAWPIRMPWPMFRHDNQRTGNSCYTEAPPANPSAFVSNPRINTPTTDNTIAVGWSGAHGNGCAALWGYSIQWTNAATTIPDTVRDTPTTWTTSPALANGTWWFHIRTQDLWGNWSPVAAHYGPFRISR